MTGFRLISTVVLVLTLASASSCQVTQPPDALKAIKAGDVQGALRALDSVQNVNADNGALLYEAVMQRQADVIEKLLKKGADPNLRSDLLVNTVLNKWDSTTLLLLQLGADPNKNSGGASALSEASLQGNLAVMKELIQRDADVNYNDYVGAGSPLILAVEQNRFEAAQLLLEHGADPSIEAKFHGYPWKLARQSKDRKIFEVLARYRANCKDQPDRCK